MFLGSYGSLPETLRCVLNFGGFGIYTAGVSGSSGDDKSRIAKPAAL